MIEKEVLKEERGRTRRLLKGGGGWLIRGVRVRCSSGVGVLWRCV